MSHLSRLALFALCASGCFFIRGVEHSASAPPGWYRVSVERALIHSSNEQGKPWDFGVPGTEAPDVYVQILFGDESFRTPVVPNTYQPMWVGSFDALLGVTPGPAIVRVLLWDRDPDADDPIGEVTLDLYQVIASGGVQVTTEF